MAGLLDLDAVELIDDIRRLFDQGCVDIGCAGDIEDVELELGLRSERDTPRPSYGGLSGLLRTRPVDGDDIYVGDDIYAGVDIHAGVDHYLALYANDDSIFEVSELDGFFAALACAPDLIPPSRWMPAIWGGDEASPEWQTLEDARAFSEMVMTLYNEVVLSFTENVFEALFLEREVEGATYTIVDEWCAGFLRGLGLWGHLVTADQAELEECLQPLALFATEQGFESQESMQDADIALEQMRIEPSVRRLYRHFAARRNQARHPFVRNTPKVGRNDPCPCGSGKKYKHCCLH